MFPLEVIMHCRGASTTGCERLATVLAEHLSGGVVVSRFGEVKPNPASEWTISDVSVDRGG